MKSTWVPPCVTQKALKNNCLRCWTKRIRRATKQTNTSQRTINESNHIKTLKHTPTRNKHKHDGGVSTRTRIPSALWICPWRFSLAFKLLLTHQKCFHHMQDMGKQDGRKKNSIRWATITDVSSAPPPQVIRPHPPWLQIFLVFGPGKTIQHSHGPQAVLCQAHDGNDKAKQEKKLCPTRINVTELRVVGKDLPTSTAIQMQSYGKTKPTTHQLGNHFFSRTASKIGLFFTLSFVWANQHPSNAACIEIVRADPQAVPNW